MTQQLIVRAWVVDAAWPDYGAEPVQCLSRRWFRRCSGCYGGSFGDPSWSIGHHASVVFLMQLERRSNLGLGGRRHRGVAREADAITALAAGDGFEA